MQSHFSPCENTALYISVITPWMHRRRFIYTPVSCWGYLWRWRFSNKTVIRLTRFVSPFTYNWEGASIGKLFVFWETLAPNRISTSRMNALLLPTCISSAGSEMVKLTLSSFLRAIRSCMNACWQKLLPLKPQLNSDCWDLISFCYAQYDFGQRSQYLIPI